MGFNLLLSCVLITFEIAVIMLNIKHRKKYAILPPGPSPWPIVGSLPERMKNRPTYKWATKLMKQLATDIVCIRLGNVDVVVVSSAVLAREFLHKNDAIFSSRPNLMSSEYASFGYLTMGLAPHGQQWKKMRKMYVRELMSSARVRWLLNKRNEEADNLVQLTYNQCSKNPEGGEIIDIRLTVRQYCANVIRKMAFGKRYFEDIQHDGSPGDAEKQHVKAIFDMLKYMDEFCISDYLPWLRFLDIVGLENKLRTCVKVIEKYHNPIIEDRIKQWKDKRREHPEDFLDILITLNDESGRPLLSIDEIKAQCTELFFPCDNPSNAVEWIIAEMINQPNIMQEAREEIDKVVGKDRLVEENDIPKLSYLKACVRESLRLHPVTPFVLPHLSTEDANIAGYFIPKGTQVLLLRHMIGRDPKVWDEPLQFDPSRHLKDPSKKVEISEPSLNFIAFSVGMRGCPAMPLGVAMTMMLLGRLVQGFTWNAPPNCENKIDLSEASHGGLYLSKPLHAHAKPRLPTTTYGIPI
ncbi:hypothetical protein Leryth_023947 [Lithospermum erythrorhizon]|nr:hypothetical protein Leryth_023947 [Lithospermum erythrorhizon]